MPATTDLLRKYKSLFSTTLSTGIGTGTGDTITPASVSGLPTDTLITLTFDRVDSGGVATPTKLERIQGIISGGNFTSYTRGVDGTTEQAHSGGAVIEMIWNADDWNDAVTWGLTEHNQLGGHTNITASNITASATLTGTSISGGNITASATTSSLHYKVQAAGDLLDANGNELLKFTQTASAVNELTIGNAITASDVTLTATGGDTNVSLNLVPKGSGTVKVSGTTIPTASSTTAFTNKTITDSSNDVMAKSLKSATTTIDVSAATAPSSGQVLTATGTTAATWQTPATGALSSKIITATRDLSAASGDVSYTGAGFIPTSIIALYGIDAGVMMGVGFSDSAKAGQNVDRDNTDATHANNYIVCAITTGSNNQLAIVKSYDADGFTLTWTKTGTPTGSLNMYFLCHK